MGQGRPSLIEVHEFSIGKAELIKKEEPQPKKKKKKLMRKKEL